MFLLMKVFYSWVWLISGLRTLCIAKRNLSEEYYAEWNRKHEIASSAIDEREIKLEEVSDAIERELQLLGGTAIEDRLQDGVPDAIQHLSDGGIKLWVLTGDRVETAINIGFSCNLLSNSMELIVFKVQADTTPDEAEKQLHDSLEKYFQLQGTAEELKAAQHDHSPPPPTHALIIDGDALKLVLEEPLKSKFLLLCKQCKSVICCRVSPSQKALVVRMVKTGLDVMTLSIGDGANDVAMIQEAHVGVGIAGEEGRQAVMSSDYAIGQFRFLSRLVLVHGRWSYRRIAEMVANFFYKVSHFKVAANDRTLYGHLRCSGIRYTTISTALISMITRMHLVTPFLTLRYILLVNLVFTSLPVIFMGAFDQDVTAEVAMKVPQLYKRGILRLEWTAFKFWYSLSRSIWL
jgi:phospholipid-translocating ATPase